MPVGRIAPAPTGAQHVGNARTYLLAWLSVRSREGRLILRIEDLDSPRLKSWAVDQALEDVAWLGLDWTEGPDIGGPHAPYIQSQRRALYDDALRQLKQAERVYPCTCTRRDVAAAASAPHAEHEGPNYPGTCAGRSVADAARLGEQPFVWRFRASNVERAWHDRVIGTKAANVARELGDFIIARGDGAPAYQLAVVVDDHVMGVSEVLRGDDLVPSTWRQLDLYDFFGWQPPEFAHVPLVVGPDGRRLAKRHGDTRLAQLREAGKSPERLIGLLAWSAGLIDEPRPCQPADLLDNFDLAQLPRTPWVLTADLWQSLLT
ncbi:MAG: tRNA glutamyl-Q(34) synthetase GluQRS [Planctomycetes bacterium]|nr:tRNA glutamyl-Q(34) synthetase GluQRS [Planctomycetota bacterium]